MIPLTTLYDGYIDRPKLTEQKNPFEYLVPPPLKWVGTKIALNVLEFCVRAHIRYLPCSFHRKLV